MYIAWRLQTRVATHHSMQGTLRGSQGVVDQEAPEYITWPRVCGEDVAPRSAALDEPGCRQAVVANSSDNLGLY